MSVYAQAWVGMMSPLWLMGEAIMPRQKVGGTFKKGANKLQGAAMDVREAVSTTCVTTLDDFPSSSSPG